MICWLVVLIVLFIEKSTGSSAQLEVEYDDVTGGFERATLACEDCVLLLLEYLHMFKTVPPPPDDDGLLFEFSEKASSITLSRVSWSNGEMYGTIASLTRKFES